MRKLSPAEQAHIEQFNEELRKVGKRIGAFLHARIDAGQDISSPATRQALPLTAYELSFVLEAIESHLLRERERN